MFCRMGLFVSGSGIGQRHLLQLNGHFGSLWVGSGRMVGSGSRKFERA
jgi:hypothetical protein